MVGQIEDSYENNVTLTVIPAFEPKSPSAEGPAGGAIRECRIAGCFAGCALEPKAARAAVRKLHAAQTIAIDETTSFPLMKHSPGMIRV
jgi:hypothetical protein